MKIVILNPPHRSIGSRVPGELLPPLGLLRIAGPLLDAGHEVRLINADIAPMTLDQILAELSGDLPEILMLGHSGSTSAHPVVIEIAAAARRCFPNMRVIYSGVFPSYHWEDILRDVPQIDVIVRGEGEETTADLISAMAAGSALEDVRGIAFRREGRPFATTGTDDARP